MEPWEQWRERIQGLKREWSTRIIARENDEARAVLTEALEKAEQAGIHVPNAFEANEALWEAIDRRGAGRHLSAYVVSLADADPTRTR